MNKEFLKLFFKTYEDEYWYGASYEHMCDYLEEFLKNNQPERSKREDSQECEMRCSEHCGNTVRDK